MVKRLAMFVVSFLFAIDLFSQSVDRVDVRINRYQTGYQPSSEQKIGLDGRPVFLAQDSRLSQKNCTGALTDLNCYTDMIRKHAVELNRKDERRAFRNAQINGHYAPMRAYFKGRQVMIDTADQESCNEIRAELLSYYLTPAQTGDSIENLCEMDPQHPFDTVKTITIMGDVDEEYVRSYSLTALTSTENTLINQTRNTVITMGGVLGIMYTLPKSITKWGNDNHWIENVSRPPVIDKDDPWINYIGHPVSGAFYYTIARNLGYSKMQSFGYTVVMSTFFWEYGFEALAERPSIQDLIITPIFGSLLGELFFDAEQKIRANGGRVNGSRTLGKIALFVLNPIGHLSEQINKFLGTRMIQDSKFELVTGRRKVSPALNDSATSNYIGVRVRFIGNFL